ncbi:MAG: sulfur carrier protein ThiS [Acidobacteriota bacterium]
MLITLNGEKTTVAENCTVQSLIEKLGLDKVRVAVEVNREIVPRSRWAEHLLKPDDQVEVVHFVGGGERF